MRNWTSKTEMWLAVDAQRPKDLAQTQWRKSYDGVRAIIESVPNVKLITTREELDAIPVEMSKNGHGQFMERKVKVSRNGVVSPPNTIKDIIRLNGVCLSATERSPNAGDKKETTRPLRSITDIWNSVENQRPEGMSIVPWKSSYAGVRAAIESLPGLKLVTTREELDVMPIPLDRDGRKNSAYRKVRVTRDGVLSEPTDIKSIMSGNAGMLTEFERDAINQSVSIKGSAACPKGTTTHNNFEARAIDELDELIASASMLQRRRTIEHRLADVGYCMLNDDPTGQVFVADQVKSSHATIHGQAIFGQNGIGGLTVETMVSMLASHMSITCIGKTRDDKLDVVWFFHGPDDSKVLQQFKTTQVLQPMLHLQKKSHNLFTNTINQSRYRFDVGSVVADRARLLQRKVDAVRNGVKRTLEFLNEDHSQIPSKCHQLEQVSIAMTKIACESVGAQVDRIDKDAYSSVDFRVNRHTFDARVQDKTVPKKDYNLRSTGRHPYSPDAFDALQITFVEERIVYVFPMRTTKDDVVESFFTADELMVTHVYCNSAWKASKSAFRHDLKTEDGVRSYLAACEAAASVPQLTDRDFYPNILKANAHLFGSKKQLARRKASSQPK